MADKIEKTYSRVKTYQTKTDVRSDLTAMSSSPWIAPLMQQLAGVFG